MKYFIAFSCIAIITQLSCYIQEANYSTIPNPEARWHSYKSTNYTVTQIRDCYCINGGKAYSVTVRNNHIVDVVDPVTHAHLDSQQIMYYKTIDALFDIIRTIPRDSVADFRVEYDALYGFPTMFWVDPSAAMADEEYGYRTSTLTLQGK